MKKIMVIEDDFEIRDTIQSILEESNYEIVMAASVSKSIDYLSKESFELIICDILLPDGDSFEILEWINRHVEIIKPPIIILSAIPQRDYIAKAEKFGISDFFSKPFRVKELLLAINKYLK